MGAFQSGFQMGGSIAQDAMRLALQEREMAMREAAEQRAATEFGWKKDDMARRDAAFDNYNNVAAGIGADQSAQLKQTYGMNPSQISRAVAAGGADGLKAQLASYDVPDSYDMQGGAAAPAAPATGVQPGRFTADQLKTVEPTRMGRERAMEQLAVAMRDPRAMRESQNEQLVIQKNDIATGVMKMPLKELEAMAPDINMSGYPLLYTGKGKNGYTFLKTEADGKTPIPGSTFTLNESQLRQMAMAHALGQAGFGTDAMATLSSAHKDIHEHVKGWNDAQTKLVTTNNQGAHFAESGENQRAHIGVLKGHYNKPNYTQFEDDKGNPVYLDLSKAPQGANGQLQLPAGIRPMKQAAQLSDMEKIGYGKALEQISMLPPDAPPSAIASVYRRNGLDPAKFGGGGGLPASWGPVGPTAPGAAVPGAPGATGIKTYGQRLQESYDRWQAAKAPWYMPTPTANSAERDAEEEYTQLLRAGR